MDDVNILNIGISLNGLAKNDTIINKYKDGKKFRDFFDSLFASIIFNYLGNDLKFVQYYPII